MQANVKNVELSSGKNRDAEVQSKQKNIGLEVRNLLTDIECLIADATTMTNEELEKAKAKLKESVDSLKNSFSDLDGSITERARRGVVITNNYVHEQPWPVIGASALVGVVVGVLLARRY